MTRQGIHIRAARASDLARVQEVEDASFSIPWGTGSFRSLLGLARVRFLVATLEDSVVGHGVLWWVQDEGELANIAVDPSVRGGGVAGVLLDALLAEAREIGLDRVFLEARVSNEAALRLYRSRGFVDVGVRRGYYRQPKEDALILRVGLPSTDHRAHEKERATGRERDELDDLHARAPDHPDAAPPGGDPGHDSGGGEGRLEARKP